MDWPVGEAGFGPSHYFDGYLVAIDVRRWIGRLGRLVSVRLVTSTATL
jgi:hypothetical protein